MRGQRWGAMVALAMAGCGGASPDDTSPDTVPQGGACGEVTTWDVAPVSTIVESLSSLTKFFWMRTAATSRVPLTSSPVTSFRSVAKSAMYPYVASVS